MIGTFAPVAVAAAIAWLIVRAPVRVALASLLATSFLIPGTLLVPGSPSTYLTIHRLFLGLLVLNIARKIARGDVSAAVFKPTPTTVLLAGWVVLTFIIGVAMADARYPIGFASFLWVFIVDYAIFFWFVVAAIRAIEDPWWVARLAVGLLVVSAGIATYERVTGNSFGRFLGSRLAPIGRNPISVLGFRGGNRRVQAGFDFALAYGWAAAMLLPLAVAVARRARARLLRIMPVLVVASILWTYARSAYVAVAAGALLLLFASRFDRTILAYFAVGAVAVAVFFVGSATYRSTFSSTDSESSSIVREERLPLILAGAAQRPLTGKGLASASIQGIRTTDSLFLLTYAELGVLGITGLGTLLMGGVLTTRRALRAPPPDHLLGGAAIVGSVLGIASGAFVDTFTVSGLSRTFWLLLALGTVTAERAPARTVPGPARRITRRRAAIPVLGVVIGLVVFAATPARASATLRFTVRSPLTEAVAETTSSFLAGIMVNTACGIIEARAETFQAEAQCYDLQTGLGMGDVRLEARDVLALNRVTLVAGTAARTALPHLRFYVVTSPQPVRPTFAKTAPVWLGLVGLAAIFLLPPVPRPPRKEGLDAVGAVSLGPVA